MRKTDAKSSDLRPAAVPVHYLELVITRNHLPQRPRWS